MSKSKTASCEIFLQIGLVPQVSCQSRLYYPGKSHNIQMKSELSSVRLAVFLPTFLANSYTKLCGLVQVTKPPLS